MALRHPLAFRLVAEANGDELPLRAYVRRLDRLARKTGFDQSDFVRLWSVLDAFATGFIMLEARALLRQANGDAEAEAGLGADEDEIDEQDAILARRMRSVVTTETFEEALEMIISGFRTRLQAPDDDNQGG